MQKIILILSFLLGINIYLIYNEELLKTNVYLLLCNRGRPGTPPPLPRAGGNQSWLTAGSTQSVVIRYLTDQKGQPNQLLEGTEWHMMA